ncbi:MAG: RNA-directed DNA polymerase [Bacteroidales bacterium]|nr:RNA-directed DNA polymerase [Bacteroidales bacterium]
MDKTLVISGIEINVSQAIRRLKKDIEDDWFKDPFMFKDFLTDDFVIEKLKMIDFNRYSASRRQYFDIPKNGFVLRYSIETNIIDRVVYQGLIDIIGGDLDSKLGVEVYSHRICNTKERDSYFFRHPVEQWRAFNKDVTIDLQQHKDNVLLVTDLTNFYENISVKKLGEKLSDLILELDISCEKKINYKRVVQLLTKILTKWSVPETGSGIPQNRNPSSFLANIYLKTVDETMIKNGYKYYRYMDDLRFVCQDRYEARLILKNLIAELRNIGLNVNAKKTEILAQNHSNLTQYLPIPDREIEQIDELFKSKKAIQIQKAIPLLEAKTLKLIEGKQTSSREFRFCIFRYEKLLRITEMRESIDVSKLTPCVLGELLEQPWSTDSFFRFLECVDLSPEECQQIANILFEDILCTYEWQVYYLWQLLIAKKFKTDKLLGIARKKIKSNQHKKPEIAACCLYLSAVGSTNDKQFIAENFIIFKDFFTQRIALIAVKDLSYSRYIEPYVMEHIIPEYIGTYKILGTSFSDLFYIAPSPIPVENLYNELPDINS